MRFQWCNESDMRRRGDAGSIALSPRAHNPPKWRWTTNQPTSLEELGRVGVPVETLCIPKAGIHQATTGGRTGMQGLQSLKQTVDTFRVDDTGGVANHLSQRASGRTDDGTSAGHGFDGRHAKAFEQGRIDESRCGPIQVWKVGVFDKAEESNVVGKRRGGGGGMDVFGTEPIASPEGKQPRRTGSGLELVECLDQADMVFRRMLKAGDVEEVGLLEPGKRWGGGGVEAAVIQTIEDETLALERNAKESLDVRGGVRADGDDLVLSFCEPFDEDTTVDHAREVVFALHVEGGEIMDGGNGGARGAPEHSAIAGDVEDIDALLFEPSWQDELMPKDVLHGGTPFLSDGDDFHAISDEVEEWQVFLEDEEMEFVLVGLFEEGSNEGEDVLGDAGFAALDDAGGDGDFHAREA